jgi:hypothetical protein
MSPPARLPTCTSLIGARRDRERDDAIAPRINIKYLNVLVNTIE